jgi:3-dehydroquinate synthase
MSPLDTHQASRSVDIDFNVPFRHRLRFTDDCFGSDWKSISSLFETREGRARLQVWVDGGITAVDSALVSRIERSIRGCPDLELANSIAVLEGGERVKNSDQVVQEILTAIHRDCLDRRNYILVVGGGAVLDAVGYAAAIAHRGIRLVRFPTTTLAQADSGVGVKNAVNAFEKKNWKGTFAVPWAVVNDRRLLSSQQDRDFRSGFSEAVKVALLKSPTTFEWLCSHAVKIASRDMPSALQAIRDSVLTHLHHIAYGGDPFEANEARPLDFGHWSAHKLESLCRYQLRHGEAVAIGVALDVVYSSLAHGLAMPVVESTLQVFRNLQLLTYHDLLQTSAIFDGLEEFRQHLGGRLTLTMLSDVGKMLQVHEVDYNKMRQAIEVLRLESLK